MNRPESNLLPPVSTADLLVLDIPPSRRPWITPDYQLHVHTPSINHIITLSRSPTEFRELRLLLWKIKQRAKVLLEIFQMDSLNSALLRCQKFEERSEKAVHGLHILQRDLSE
jgi:hypothetical protein